MVTNFHFDLFTGVGIFALSLAIVISIYINYVGSKFKLDEVELSEIAIEDKFKSKPLLTDSEFKLLSFLEEAVPEFRFLSKVGAAAILDADVSRTVNKDEYKKLRAMFDHKLIDFVVQSRTDGTVVALIELNHGSRCSRKTRMRDAMFTDAGYRVLRWNVREMPGRDVIRRALVPGFACPKEEVLSEYQRLNRVPRHAAAPAGQC